MFGSNKYAHHIGPHTAKKPFFTRLLAPLHLGRAPDQPIKIQRRTSPDAIARMVDDFDPLPPRAAATTKPAGSRRIEAAQMISAPDTTSDPGKAPSET